MSYAVQVDESNASRRVVYLWCVQSNGTSAATNEATGRPHMSVGGLSMWTTANTLSAVSANAGHYSLVLGASDISLLGQGTILYSSATALPISVPVEIVGYNPFVPYSRFTSDDSVGLKAVTHSGATVAGLVSTVSIRDGAYSAVTIGGVTRVNSNVTIADGAYSAVTVRVNGPIALTSAVTLAAGRYSNVTIGGVEKAESAVTINTGGIIAASFAAGAIDAVALATDAGQEIADRFLQRNIMGGSDSGRTVSEAFAVLRNRVAIDGSAVTVYRENDTTAYWTASIATVSTNSGLISDLNPA